MISSLVITDEMFLIMETHSALKRFESELSKASITGKKNQVSTHLTTVIQSTYRAQRRMTSSETSLMHSLVTRQEPFANVLLTF